MQHLVAYSPNYLAKNTAFTCIGFEGWISGISKWQPHTYSATKEGSIGRRISISLDSSFCMPQVCSLPHAGSRSGSTARDTSQSKLQMWVRRELTAVLRTDDVSLLTSLVMGVALSFKAASNPSEDQPESSRGALRALEPYLGSEAHHFWHELRYGI